MILTLMFHVDRAIEGDTKLEQQHIADTLTGVADYIRNNGINWRAGRIIDNAKQIGVWKVEL